MSAPFSFSLKRSPLLRSLTALAHVMPLSCAFFADTRPLVLSVVGVLTLVSAVATSRQGRELGQLRLTVVPQGVSVLEKDGRALEVDILPESVDLGWLIVLVLVERNSRIRRRAALTRGALDAESWRSLRRFLRWELPDEAQAL